MIERRPTNRELLIPGNWYTLEHKPWTNILYSRSENCIENNGSFKHDEPVMFLKLDEKIDSSIVLKFLIRGTVGYMCFGALSFEFLTIKKYEY